MKKRSKNSLTDRTAMIDMAAAFGHGARKKRKATWDIYALMAGEDDMERRLNAAQRPYWEVRDDALELAEWVGGKAADYAYDDPDRNLTKEPRIETRHLERALRDLTIRGDCPFN